MKIKELEARYDKDVENLRNALQKETDENIYLKGKLKEHEDTCKGKNKSMTMIKLNKNIQDFVSKPSKIEEMEKEIKDLKEREMELIKELDTSKSNNMILEIRREVEKPTDIKEKEQQLQEEVKEKDKQIRTMKEEIKQYEKRLEIYVSDNLTKVYFNHKFYVLLTTYKLSILLLCEIYCFIFCIAQKASFSGLMCEGFIHLTVGYGFMGVVHTPHFSRVKNSTTT